MQRKNPTNFSLLLLSTLPILTWDYSFFNISLVFSSFKAQVPGVQ